MADRIFVIDDDYAMEALVENLQFRGYDATRIKSAESALQDIDQISKSDLVVLDIIMEVPAGTNSQSISGNGSTGMRILRALRDRHARLPILVLSGTEDPNIVDAVKAIPYTSFQSKWNSPSLRDIVAKIEMMLGKEPQISALRPFIVHGHDEVAKLALKNYLQNTLKLPEPIILHEQPNVGRTIIEKLERGAMDADLAFVLITPDDKVAASDGTNDEKRRARQNVIFEMGYFLGLFGRESGRVILLHKGPLELPSDLAGVVYIDISDGIEAAGEKIRLELTNVAR